jgi:hypothetical protein
VEKQSYSQNAKKDKRTDQGILFGNYRIARNFDD